jgi:DNA-binding CsgD family transcriptional regulator
VPLGHPLLDTLERLGYGGMILGSDAAVLRLNSIAKRLLVEQTGIGERERENAGVAQEAFRSLLRRVSPHASKTAKSWFVVPHDGKRQLILRAIALQSSSFSSDPETDVVILIDLNEAPRLEPATLQRIFDLTSAQARLAMELARGKTLTEISEAQNISTAAARSLLAAIFAKTNTRRQHELISLLAKVALLP